MVFGKRIDDADEVIIPLQMVISMTKNGMKTTNVVMAVSLRKNKKNGDTYAGEWRDGRRHDEGKYIYSGGNIYEGNRKRNKQQGIGTDTYVSGSIFCGEWDKSVQHGKGIFIRSDGEISNVSYIHGVQHEMYPLKSE